ncbi:MAG: MFS transporter [Rhizobiaceae bacterium]|nr:MFS transporter [Rhizobiaceae bacterium]
MSEAETITETTEVRVSATPIAMSGIIISMMFMAMASGLGFAYIPIRLSALGFEPWVANSMFPALSFGGLMGCLVTGWMLRLSGHARVFMTVYAVIILSFLMVLVTENPTVWVAARVLYGFGINGAFIVAQSWLHDSCTDEIRGRVISIFYVSYVVSLGLGSYLIGWLDVESVVPMALAVMLVTLAILPVGLTRLRQPEAPEETNIQIRKLWRVSPVGMIGMLCVGGLTMTLQGFAPIYAGTLEYTPADIGLLLLMMQMGLLVVQLPMGALSDRIDRRYVLLIVASMSSVLAIIAMVTESNLSFIWIVLVFALWSGSIETFYSVSSALANDRADPKDYVFLSSTQMLMWSLGAFIVPLFSTALLFVLPVTMFMHLILALSAAFAVFVVLRIFVREAVPQDEMENFQYSTAQVVNAGEYYNPEAIAEANAGVSEGLLG